MPTRPLFRPLSRLRFLRLAIFAVLLNALAPAMSHALAASRPALPIDVCSTHGGKALAVAAALLVQQEEGVQGHAHGGLSGDCGHCLAHAGGHGSPPPSALAPPAGQAVDERPYLFYHAPRPLPLLTSSRPRGPPAFA
jgi:hypothetical protein